MIYLDNAATTFPKPESVLRAVDECQRKYAVNMGRSVYPTANYAMEIFDETRLALCNMVHASNPNNVVITPSATIAANEVILGLPFERYKTVYVSPFEHNAIARPLYRVCREYNIELRMIPFDAETQKWDEDKTARLFQKNPPDYVFINHISNVTGLILPIYDITAMAKKYGACVIVDASQSLGLIDINIQEGGYDYVVFAGHKNLYASWGIGGFIANSNVIKPIISGGTGSDSLNLEMTSQLPVGYEPGSPNIIAISSLHAAIGWIQSVGIQNIENRKRMLMDRLIQGLSQENIKLYVPEDKASHTSVLSINVDGYEPREVGIILGEDYDIAVRTGFHCAPFIHKLLGTEATQGTVRISIGYFNTEADIDAIINAVRNL